MSYCELPSVYDHTEPVARKRHKCCECSAPILKGEKHFHAWGVWDGRRSTHRQHIVCMEACMMIRDRFNDGECVGFGCLKEEFSELPTWHKERSRRDHVLLKLRSLMAKILWRERTAKAESEAF